MIEKRPPKGKGVGGTSRQWQVAIRISIAVATASRSVRVAHPFRWMSRAVNFSGSWARRSTMSRAPSSVMVPAAYRRSAWLRRKLAQASAIRVASSPTVWRPPSANSNSNAKLAIVLGIFRRWLSRADDSVPLRASACRSSIPSRKRF